MAACGEDAGTMAEQAALGFAGLLRQLRAEARLTQEELAQAARLSPRSVSDLERGINRTARKDTALLLAGALGLAEPVRALFVAAARGHVPATEVLAARPGQAGPATAAAAGGRHGFPPVLTSFVGRAGAVREVVGLLDQHRLVMVTGPGGVGKTRLAGVVAEQVAGRFADGVWLAELAAVRDPALVASVVAAALGVPEQAGVPAADALARVLARQQLLLVLDNCEHVIGAAAGLCAGLLVACDDVRVLATSREPLRTAGEARYRLAPLTLPDPDNPAGSDGSEAVTLFADRARSAGARITLDEESGPAVARLVRRLDGMPLAIELAAARVEALGVTQLLDRLDDRLALLTSGDRLAPGRQRSLAATVAWSYQLLDDQERRVFRAVSVFPGPFTLEAAKAVAGDGAGPTVLRLVDRSLLVPPQTGPDGRTRYVMLETLRAFGAKLLTGAREQDDAAAALAGYALGVAEEAAAGLETSAGEVAAATWLDAEDATMRQVLTWAKQHDAAVTPRLAVALAPWWILRGRLVSERPLLRDAAGRVALGSDGWCATQYWLGIASLHSVDLAGALGYFTGVRDAIGHRPPSQALADCLRCRSAALSNLGRVTEAADDARRSLALSQQLGYPAGETQALAHLAVALFRAGDLDSAVQLAGQAEQRSAGIPGRIARWCSNFLTLVLTEAGELAAADRACAAGLARSREAGDPWNQARMLTRMTILDLRAARIEDAAPHLRESLQIAARTGDQFDLQNGLDCCGYLCAATGRFAEAITVWAAHAVIFRHGGYTYPPAEARRHQEAMRKAQQALGPALARTAEKRGAAMSLDTATEYALMLTAPGAQPPAATLEPGKLTARELSTRELSARELSARELSARERELVTLVAQGRTDTQIAAQLFISVRTVSTHLDRVRDKTGCRRRADLTRLALSAGLV
jgi:predicted ATPase/DNA-binding CsgD family transcriptional regulator/DNA-binding XRE family transcriptional regulator